LIYSDALKKGEEERMNLELRNSGKMRLEKRETGMEEPGTHAPCT
jgi:hypothetical protein